MTVAIGLVCSDGVIVASDSMASAGQTAFPMCKVHACQPLRMVWTAAGSVYVSEEVETEIINLASQPAVQDAFANFDLSAIRTILGANVRATMHRCYQSALPFGLQQQTPQSYHPFVSDFLFMGWGKSNPWFLEISSDGQINWHTQNGFASVGSGGSFASVAQALMDHYLDSTAMTIDEGVLVAHRAIETTCRVSSSFVAPPVWIATASEAGARVLEDTEIARIQTEVEGWKRIEKDTLYSLRADPKQENEITVSLPTLSGDD